MWEIWAKQFLRQALKSCPKSNKSPNLVKLLSTNQRELTKGVSSLTGFDSIKDVVICIYPNQSNKRPAIH